MDFWEFLVFASQQNSRPVWSRRSASWRPLTKASLRPVSQKTSIKRLHLTRDERWAFLTPSSTPPSQACWLCHLFTLRHINIERTFCVRASFLHRVCDGLHGVLTLSTQWKNMASTAGSKARSVPWRVGTCMFHVGSFPRYLCQIHPRVTHNTPASTWECFRLFTIFPDYTLCVVLKFYSDWKEINWKRTFCWNKFYLSKAGE